MEDKMTAKGYKSIEDFTAPKTLKNKVFKALGEVSMCWSETPKGIFDSTNAERIGNELMKNIDSEIEVYRKIAYEIAKSQTGKFLLMDVNLLPKAEDFDETKLLDILKQANNHNIAPSSSIGRSDGLTHCFFMTNGLRVKK